MSFLSMLATLLAMNKYFKNYIWKNGTPYGINPVEQPEKENTSYKIIMDPYRKRISVESYCKGAFAAVIYDSILLDFRKLNPQEQLAWQRETIKETEEELVSLIRNSEDRVILIEEQYFLQQRCSECRIYSPNRIHLSTHKMVDNEVVLFDANGVVVMKQKVLDESDL